MEPVEVDRYLVEFIGIQVAVDVRGDGRRRMAHRFLYVAKVSAGLSGQGWRRCVRLLGGQLQQEVTLKARHEGAGVEDGAIHVGESVRRRGPSMLAFGLGE